MMLTFLPSAPDLLPEADRFETCPHPREMLSLVGHEAAERQVLEALRAQRMHHAWLVSGDEGIGKATLAYRIARFLLANPDPVRWGAAQTLDVPASHPAAHQIASGGHPDLAVMRRQLNDKSKSHFTEIRVGDVRAALDIFNKTAAMGGYRIAIVDSCDELNANGANALLKTLEEPPPRSLFLLVAHRAGAVLPTIRSRCRHLPLHPLSEVELRGALAGFPGVTAETSVLEQAARASDGSMRRALALLDGKRLAFDTRLRQAFDALPDTTADVIDAIAEAMAGRAGDDAFEQFCTVAEQWISLAVRRPGRTRTSLVALAELSSRIRERRRQIDALNLDRRPFVVTTFADLARALR